MCHDHSGAGAAQRADARQHTLLRGRGPSAPRAQGKRLPRLLGGGPGPAPARAPAAGAGAAAGGDTGQLRGGDLALGAALDAHLARLGVELERAERSQAVCRDILGSGESFEALDAPRWLAELSARGPKPAEGFDSVPPLICPWRRFFARNLDLMLCTILPLAAAALLFRPNYQPQGFGFTVIRTLVTLAALFVAEPLLLHFWGTTPGKWLLGLSVESESGGRLSLGEAWGRTTGLICYGLGFYLPLVSLVTCAVSYQKHSSGRPLSWEAGSELRLRDRGRAAGVAGYICLCALLFFVAAWTLLDAQLPRHRGEMSAAEFCENYNSLAAMHGLHSDGKRLTAEGWIDINHSLTIGNLSARSRSMSSRRRAGSSLGWSCALRRGRTPSTSPRRRASFSWPR